jgi:hypothetical protein
MTPLLVLLVILGALLAAYGAVDAYRSRMREDPPGSGLYSPPNAGKRGLILGLVGAALALVSGLIGVLA